MKRTALFPILLWSGIATTEVSAQGTSSLVIARAATRPTRVAPAENITGIARVTPLFDTTAAARAYGATVSFDVGARTSWHMHPRGQVLIVTDGVGRAQVWGGPVEEIRPGDVVRIPPGAKHWHGAAPTTAMTHIAIVEYLDGRNTEWMEKVSDAQYGAPPSLAAATGTNAEQEVLSLSRQKWGWMSERKVDTLAAFFHDEAVFVHMGGSMSRNQELEVIRTGAIHYKQAEIQSASVRLIGTTAIVLNRIRLLAVVGGNEVTNPFEVTEVYVRQNGAWKLASLSFTRLLGQ